MVQVVREVQLHEDTGLLHAPRQPPRGTLQQAQLLQKVELLHVLQEEDGRATSSEAAARAAEQAAQLPVQAQLFALEQVLSAAAGSEGGGRRRGGSNQVLRRLQGPV